MSESRDEADLPQSAASPEPSGGTGPGGKEGRVDSDAVEVGGPSAAPAPAGPPLEATVVAPPKTSWLNRNVLGAGLTSAFGDVAHESATTILPGFLTVLGIPAAPAALGIIEGLSDATSSLTKLGSGYYSDRIGRRKPLVVAGYALTGCAQALYALAHGWPLILAGRLLAWFGRGVKGPLRDAILSESIPPGARGKVFGFHRAADTLGAIAGPLLGALLLSWLQNHLAPGDPTRPYRWIFWATLIPGFLSVASFALLVREPARVGNRSLKLWATVRDLPRDFRKYLAAVGLFGIGDFAPSLLILAAAQLLAPRWGEVRAAEYAALLYLWRNIVYAAAAFPVGALADRFGHARVLTVGYALGAVTAVVTAGAFAATQGAGWPLLVTIFTLAGLYIAIEDSLESSMTAEFTRPEVRGTAYGVLGTVNGLGDFVASAAVGLLWTMVSPTLAFGVAAAVMALGAASLGRLTSQGASSSPIDNRPN